MQVLKIKKKVILTFVITWMDLEGIMLNRVSQKENHFTHVEYKEKKKQRKLKQ